MLKNMKIEKNAAGREVAITGAPWEPVIGYSRAMRVGDRIEVTGTIGLGENGACPDDPAEQMRNSLAIVIRAIEMLGGRREDILRTRIYLTDISLWEEVGRIHAELLSGVLPTTTMVEVSRLADPSALLEVEASAVVGR